MTQSEEGTPHKRRILIMSASFGGGHKSAAEALVRYYAERYPEQVETRVVDFFDEFMPGVNVLARFAYTQSVQFFPAGYGAYFEISNMVPANPVIDELKLGGFTRAAEYLEAYRPHAVISTFPVAGGVVTDIKQQWPMVSATVITDYGVHNQWLHPSTDLYFVACKEVREDLVVRGIPWDRVVVSGIPVHEKFSEPVDRTAVRKQFELSERFTALLTAAAGWVGDVRDIAEQLADKGIQVSAVTGTNRRLKRRLETLEKRQPLVRVFGYSNEMHKMMRAADVLVGKAGGLTVSEALAVGLPLIIFNPVPGQELFNVDFLVNSGAGFLARDEEDVVEKVRFLSTHPQRLEQMAGNAETLGKPAAAATVCERVLAATR